MTLAHPKDISRLAPILMQEPYQKFNSWYDKEGDVLYLNFVEPNYAEDSELTDDDWVIRYGKKGEVIGVTILHASKRKWGFGFSKSNVPFFRSRIRKRKK